MQIVSVQSLAKPSKSEKFQFEGSRDNTAVTITMGAIDGRPVITSVSASDVQIVQDILSQIQQNQAVQSNNTSPNSGLPHVYSGNFTIPTKTTPTLTPTTMKNIAESLNDYQNQIPPIPLEHNMQACFAPPVLSSGFAPSDSLQLHTLSEVKQEIIEEDAGYVSTPWTGPHQDMVNGMKCSGYADAPYEILNEASNSHASNQGMTSQSQSMYITNLDQSDTSMENTSVTNSRGTHGANTRRKPYEKKTQSTSKSSTAANNPGPSRVRGIKDEARDLPLDEAERRKIRRERNKEAAARCRQRRMDKTNELQEEVDRLQEIQNRYIEEERQLKQMKLSLERRLSSHNCVMKMSTTHFSPPADNDNDADVDNDIISQSIITQPPIRNQESKRPRPTTLAVNIFDSNVHIKTPSAVSFSFEGIVEGTGITPSGTTPLIPFSPSCATQQQRSSTDVQTPDAQRKLVSL